MINKTCKRCILFAALHCWLTVSYKMFGFVRALRSTRFTPRQQAFTQRYITSKSAKNKVGVVESVFVMAFLFIAVLGPAGWILSDSHRKKQ